MSLFTLLLLSLSVSADAFAVAVGTGISQKKVYISQILAMAFSFGVFQGVMPIIGFYLGLFFSSMITPYDNWLAFGLLSYIGANMIYTGWKCEDIPKEKHDIFSIRSLIILGIATSIDALAVGISLTANTTDIFFPALMIGLVTFLVSYIGIEFGKRFGSRIGSRGEILGGLVIIAIGTKILINPLI